MTVGTGSVPAGPLRALGTVRNDFVIAGRWRASVGARIAVKDPATGQVLAEVAAALPSDAADAPITHSKTPRFLLSSCRTGMTRLRRCNTS
jgi:hypothetical protein